MKPRGRTRCWVWILAGLLAMLWGLAAFAEDPPAAGGGDDNVIYKKKTVYNFEDDTITGDLTRPDQEFLSGRVLAQHKSLIRIREDFKEKVLQSVGDL